MKRFLKTAMAGALVAFTSSAEADVSIRNRTVVLPADSFTVAEAPHVLLAGEITEETYEEVVRIFDDAVRTTPFRFDSGDPAVNVILDSVGGDVAAAIKIGWFLRVQLASTFVTENEICNSACVLIFAGGVRRTLIGRATLGLHRPRFVDQEAFASLSPVEAASKYDDLTAQIERYFSEMGISSRVFTSMMKTASGQMDYLDRQASEDVGLVGETPWFSEWNHANFCKGRGEKDKEWFDCP